MVDEKQNRLFGFLFNNPGPVLFSLLMLTATTLAITNIVYNQPGTHPQPLWETDNRLVTSTISKKAEPKKIVSRKKAVAPRSPRIPIPTLSPQRRANIQQTRVEPKPDPLEHTRNLQTMLSQLGFYTGKVDGMLGPQTLSAVRAFEQSKGLPQSNEIKPSLLILLQNAVNSQSQNSRSGISDLLKQQTEPTEIKIASSQEAEDPRSGMIKRVQVGLINFGNDEVSIDGVLSAQTRRAIEQFQTRFKLEVNGQPSHALIRKLENIGALTRS